MERRYLWWHRPDQDPRDALKVDLRWGFATRGFILFERPSISRFSLAALTALGI